MKFYALFAAVVISSLSAVSCRTTGTDEASSVKSAGDFCQTKRDCRGPLIQSMVICPDGSESGYSWACNANQCQPVACQGTSEDAGQFCQTKNDCRGPVIQTLVICADGSQSGHSWDCVSNKCEMVSCQGDSESDSAATKIATISYNNNPGALTFQMPTRFVSRVSIDNSACPGVSLVGIRVFSTQQLQPTRRENATSFLVNGGNGATIFGLEVTTTGFGNCGIPVMVK